MNNKIKTITELYLTFAGIGAMTFGGGYAMLPILQREIVEKKGWATEEQLADYYAVGQCTPGIIAVNTGTFVGYSQAGTIGGIAATLGVVSVPVLIILIIAAFLSSFMDQPVITHAFNGVRAGVVALILSSVIKLFKGAVKDRFTRILYIIVLVLAAAGTFITIPAAQGFTTALISLWNTITSPVFLVIIAGLAGFAVRRKGGSEK